MTNRRTSTPRVCYDVSSQTKAFLRAGTDTLRRVRHDDGLIQCSIENWTRTSKVTLR